MTRTLEFIPLKSVNDTGENPRQKMPSAELNELAASIGEHGVLQPILVERDGKGYKIVAGHRRVAAAAIAGLKEIPAQIEENGQNRRAAALTENIIRADLTPLEEAQALAQLQEETKDGVRELARRIGKGKDWVSDRLRLAKLPPKVQQRVAAGDVGLAAVPTIARIAEKVSPEAAEAVVEQTAQDAYMRRYLDAGDNIGFLVSSAATKRQLGILPLQWQGVPPARLPIDAAAKKEIVKAVKDLGPKPTQYGHTTPRQFKFDENMAGAAKKAGCLLELDRYKFVTDPAWIEKQARAQLSKWLKEPKAEVPAGSSTSGLSKEELAAAKQQELEAVEAAAKEQAERAAAIHKANLEFGKKLADKFATVEASADNIRLLVEWLLDLDGEWSDPMVDALWFVDERLQQSGDDGQIVYADEDWTAAIDLVRTELAEAKTPEELLGVFFRTLLACRYGRDPRRERSPYGYDQAPKTVGERLDAIAKKERLVPKALTKDQA